MFLKNHQPRIFPVFNKVFPFNDLLENCSDYLPTYYQAGKFFETINEQKAIEIYKKGIKLATEQKNNHTKGELQTALSIID